MTPRLATIDDRDDIAALHVQAWAETYPSLLPQSEFDSHNLEQRLRIWGAILTQGMPVSYLPGIGFAHMGRSRNDAMRDTYPLELYSLYTLRHAHGSGSAQALLSHAIGARFQPFTAEVLKGNARAERFYEKIGGQRLSETAEEIDGMTCTHILMGYSVPIQLDI